MGWRCSPEGKSDSPVYINIVDDKVTIEDAKALWGLTRWETQEEIWKMESTKAPVRYGAEWQKLGDSYTTQRPAIVTIGPAGENKSRIASLVHGGGSGAGPGRFRRRFRIQEPESHRGHRHRQH